MASGSSLLGVAGESSVAETGAVVLIAEDVPHQVANARAEVLRFVAVYAAADVVTRYGAPVEPDGEQERHTSG